MTSKWLDEQVNGISYEKFYDTLFSASIISLTEEYDPEEFVKHFPQEKLKDMLYIVHTLAVWLNSVGFMLIEEKE